MIFRGHENRKWGSSAWRLAWGVRFEEVELKVFYIERISIQNDAQLYNIRTENAPKWGVLRAEMAEPPSRVGYKL